MTDTREAQLLHTFVTLADSLVGGYDIIDLLQTLVDQTTSLFDAAASGILLGPDDRSLEVIVSTSEQSKFIGLMQLRAGQGPCVEAVTTGQVVSVENVAEIKDRWPLFAEDSADSGFVSVHAIPMRLRDLTIGSLNLFRNTEGPLNGIDALAAQALADVATISILQERTIHDSALAQAQLQRALESRVLIEQAKGVVAHTHNLDMDTAYRLIRHHARTTQTKLSLVAAGVTDGTLDIPLSSPTK
ncbi:transcriptional regulator (plasmid) [Frondihabitans sp. PAMC 28766]|nr:GAF and ANTAR domain-containing protein [Frondihabitans sp. PAMC 28766]AMM22943.1 transcriptional regulator [Frondihabitans sp. PAMC 28766]